MAAGDITIFHQFRVDLGRKIHDLATDTFRVGFITAAVSPDAGAFSPHWAGTGTTNYATNQVTPGGNYADGGPTLGSVAYEDVGATVPWEAQKIVVAKHASNPTDARWGIIYNSTDANKRAIGFLDFGSARDLSAEPLDQPFEFRFSSVDGVGAIANFS